MVSLPYGFTLFSNARNRDFQIIKVSLPYGFTLFSNRTKTHSVIACVSLPYGFTLFSNTPFYFLRPVWFHYLMDLHYSQTRERLRPATATFHYLMDLHYSQTRPGILRTTRGFTTLWIYTILKHIVGNIFNLFRFTTLWIYTILKPQISCAHYTAQGKSTRSSTIVLWRNEIVKGAQIPIQHIEFGAHIYAHRRLAL